MKDLFDTESQGFGFHVTSHMIALAALFVACFAITGYISFRDVNLASVKYGDGYIYKVYHKVFDKDILNSPRTSGQSLGIIAEGLREGVHVISVSIEI